MKTYIPDRWVVVEITSPEHGTIDKVLGSWRGGYTGSDSWQLSSGNLLVQDCGDFWRFPQHSGSIYICNKGMYGMTLYTLGIYNQWVKDFATAHPEVTLKIKEGYE
jgi:hypothetical protein